MGVVEAWLNGKWACPASMTSGEVPCLFILCVFMRVCVCREHMSDHVSASDAEELSGQSSEVGEGERGEEWEATELDYEEEVMEVPQQPRRVSEEDEVRVHAVGDGELSSGEEGEIKGGRGSLQDMVWTICLPLQRREIPLITQYTPHPSTAHKPHSLVIVREMIGRVFHSRVRRRRRRRVNSATVARYITLQLDWGDINTVC